MANGENGFNGFVNIRLETQDKRAIKVLAEDYTAQQNWDWICDQLGDGYALSISPDFENDAIIVTLTGKGAHNVNSGFAMSQRHSDPNVALAALRFAHDEIAERGEWGKRAYDWRDTDW